MTEFKREPRYVVFKIKDIEKYLPGIAHDFLVTCGHAINTGRHRDGKPTFNAVVVEQDWPEFELVWEMIKKRMKGGA